MKNYRILVALVVCLILGLVSAACSAGDTQKIPPNEKQGEIISTKAHDSLAELQSGDIKQPSEEVRDQRIGSLVGARVSFSLSEAIQGELRDIDFWGVVIIKLEDESEVDAVVDKQLAQTLKGGDLVLIEKLKASEMWKVVSLAKE